MPATTTKKTKHAPTGSATAIVAAATGGTIAAVVAKWRAWATAMADGAACPADARELLDVGAMLGIREPGPALDHDAQVVADIKLRESRAKAMHDQCEAAIAELGGTAGIRDRIEALQRQIDELQRTLACGPAWNATEITKGARKLKASNPRMFATNYIGEGLS